jgi:hypothetical protein
MNRQTSAAATTWVPLADVHWLDAVDKTARTRDGQRGIVLRLIGRCVVLDVGDGKEATVLVSECTVMQGRQ